MAFSFSLPISASCKFYSFGRRLGRVFFNSYNPPPPCRCDPMNYDVPDLERKLQSFRTVTLPAEDDLELIDSDFLTQKSICAASAMVTSTEFFASERALFFGAFLAVKFLGSCSLERSWQTSIDVIRLSTQAGAGSGKTLPIRLNILFYNPSDHKSLTISPLKVKVTPNHSRT